MNKICGIYKITSPTGKIYIGQSKNINRRFQKYKYGECKEQPKLYHSIIKHGWDLHVFEIIHECNESQLNEQEKYYIKLYDTFNTEHGMNLTEGGDSTVFTEETKQKIKLSKLGVKRSLETKEKISNTRKEKKIGIGLVHTDEAKNKISNALKGNKNCLGVKHTDETKKKMRENNIGFTGRHHTEETKEKLRISTTGKHHTDETKEKLSKKNKGRKRTEEQIRKTSEKLKGRIPWNKKWTLEACIEDAMKYQTKNAWAKNSPSAVNSAYNNNWMSECVKHMNN